MPAHRRRACGCHRVLVRVCSLAMFRLIGRLGRSLRGRGMHSWLPCPLCGSRCAVGRRHLSLVVVQFPVWPMVCEAEWPWVANDSHCVACAGPCVTEMVLVCGSEAVGGQKPPLCGLCRSLCDRYCASLCHGRPVTAPVRLERTFYDRESAHVWQSGRGWPVTAPEWLVQVPV